MSGSTDTSEAVRQRHEQMLKLVTKGFYNELINYGVKPDEILRVTGHLLDNIMQKDSATNPKVEYYNRLFTIKDLRDEWKEKERLSVHEVTLKPLGPASLSWVVSWLGNPAIRNSFHPPFPVGARELEAYFGASDRKYFVVHYQEQPVGLIGAEHIDTQSSKLEMRKLIGNPNLQGKGIGKRATFLFLYYVFVILKFNKVYLHSLDINIRNLNLNSKFGFELEGVFFEEAVVENRKQDVVRMGLRAPVWLSLFSGR